MSKNNKRQKMEKSKVAGQAGSTSTATTDAESMPPLANKSSTTRAETEAKTDEKLSCNTPETEPKKGEDKEPKDSPLMENTADPPATFDESVHVSEDEEYRHI